MNARQLKIIALVLGVAVVLYLPRLFRDSGAGGSLDAGEGFSFVVADSVAGIDILLADGAGAIRLASTAGGWMVDGYVADEPKIRDVLGVIVDLSSTEIVARNPSNHAAMGVSEEGRRIEVRTGAGGSHIFHLGERDQRSGGYFVRLPGDPVVYRLDGPTGGYLSRERDGWRPRRIASVDTAAVREILIRRGEREATLRRGAGDWLVDDAPADSATVARLLAVLPSISASGFPTREEEEAADFSLADASFEVFSAGAEDVTDRQLALSLRLLSDEERGDWLARIADGTEAFRISALTVDRLLAEDLLPEP